MELLRKIFAGKETERKNLLLIIFLIGLLLITFIPSFTKKEADIDNNLLVHDITTSRSYETELEQRLEQTLSNVSGAGDVDVLITTTKGAEIVVSENFEEINNLTNDENGNRTTEQKTIKKSTQVLGQNDEPLVLTELNPTISGVIIVSSGANDVYVKDSLIRSVSTLLDIPSYKVEVLQKK